MSSRSWLRTTGWRHLLLLAFVAFALYPIAWILSAAFNSVNSLGGSSLIPRSLTTANFQEMFANPSIPIDTWLRNSFVIGVVAAGLNVFVAAAAAYAFSRQEFRGRRGLLTLLLILQIFPQFLGFVAFFILAQDISQYAPWMGLNTHLFLILVYLGGAAGFNAYLLKGFLDAIPRDLDQAAKIDGASDWGIFRLIIMPLARPMLAVIFIISFVTIFNEFVLASFLLSGTSQLTLPVGLQALLAEGYNAKWGLLAATSLIGALPVVAVFLFAQKQIIGGLTQGAVKG